MIPLDRHRMDPLHRLHWMFERREAARNPGEGFRLLNLQSQVEDLAGAQTIGFDWPRLDRGRPVEVIRSLLFLLRRLLNLIHMIPTSLVVIHQVPAWRQLRLHRMARLSSRKSREGGSVLRRFVAPPIRPLHRSDRSRKRLIPTHDLV
jgi:hypothetical protein